MYRNDLERKRNLPALRINRARVGNALNQGDQPVAGQQQPTEVSPMIKLTPSQRESFSRIYRLLSNHSSPWQPHRVTETYREFRKRICHKSITFGTVTLHPIDGFEGFIRIEPDGYVRWNWME
jgi:hypothetical protein|tara:strand:- start:549 stop:917 length:369 start_codon:yes stop_codon:yes gene_type:complete